MGLGVDEHLDLLDAVKQFDVVRFSSSYWVFASSRGLRAHVALGNAESLDFPDGSFDLVVSSGVLHYTPEVQRALAEARRVCAPGGLGKITLYRIAWYLSRPIFPLVRGAMRLTGTRHPGADLATRAHSPLDFVRMYDGEANPIGRALPDREWTSMLRRAGWTIKNSEHHYFPRRMMSRLQPPDWMHRYLDRALGTMKYFDLRAGGVDRRGES